MRLPAWFSERVEPTPDQSELRVSTLELFVDLVFVFTMTRFTTLLAEEHHIGSAVPQTVLMFGVIWYMFAAYAWLTNTVPPVRPAGRFFLLCGMAGWLIVALSVPTAFSPDGGQLGIAVGLLIVVVVHGLMYLQFTTRILTLLSFNLAGVACIFVAQAFATGLAAYLLWGLAVVVMISGAHVTGQEGFPLHPGHIIERHGLVVIVALGESVVAIGLSVGDRTLDATLITVAILGLALSACLWWAHFSIDLERAEAALREARDQVRRTRMVLFGLFYAHTPLLLGIVATAAGVEHALADATHALSVTSAALIAGGIALFLIGSAAFRYALGLSYSGFRVAVAAVVLLTIPLGTFLAATQLVAILAIMITMLTIEHHRLKET